MAEEKTNSDIGSWVGQAWNSAKIYQGSNFVKRHDAIVERDTIQSLGNFSISSKHLGETIGIDPDIKDDDRLKKYTITKITPGGRNKDEIENPMEIYLISDEYGHDIGTLEITENGTVFKLSDKIKDSNDALIRKFAGDDDKKIDELTKKYEVKSLEDLTKKLAKGEEIAINSVDQLKDEELKEKNNNGYQMETKEDPEEKAAIESIPSDMRSEVIAMCREENISIKDVLIVDCPKCLSEELHQDKSGIRENGGPVVLVRAHNKGAGLKDEVFAFQDNKKLDGFSNSEPDKARMLELMEQHKGEGAVRELDDKKQDAVEKGVNEAAEEAKAYVEEEMGKFPKGENIPEEIENQIMKAAHDKFDSKVCDVIEKNDYVPGKELAEDIHREHDNVQEHTEAKIDEQEQEDDNPYPTYPGEYPTEHTHTHKL